MITNLLRFAAGFFYGDGPGVNSWRIGGYDTRTYTRGPGISRAGVTIFIRVMKQVLVFCVCVLCAGAASGQSRGELADDRSRQQLLESIVEELASRGDDAAAQELMEYYEVLYENPLRINGVSEESLRRLGILTEFQIASLLEYLSTSGYILSSVELQLVNGFNERVVRLLRPFISFDYKGDADNSCSSTIMAKWWWSEGQQEYVGPPYYVQMRYNLQVGDALKFGVVVEKDAGEEVLGPSKIPFGDFTSLHLAFKDKGLLERVGPVKNITLADGVVGDYKIRFGQGLIVWNGFNLSGTSTVQGVYKGGSKILPSTSADENGYFRGAAVRLMGEIGRNSGGAGGKSGDAGRKSGGAGGKMGVESTFFISRKNVDAAIDGERYTSLPEDGLHNTDGALERRKTLGELVYGANMQFTGKKCRVGVNWVGYGYDKYNGRRVQDYNRYQMYDGAYGNFSLDFYGVAGRKRFFAEVAADYGGNGAVLAGVVARLGDWDLGGTLRWYSRGYIAPYANAYSTISSCSNQQGGAVVLQRHYQSGYKLSMGGEYAHYPWKRFNVPQASSMAKLWGRMEYLSERISWNLKFYDNYSSYGEVNKMGLKGVYGVELLHWLGVKFRGEYALLSFKESGVATAVDVDIHLLREILRFQMRGVYHNCREWGARLYLYEADLPSSYTSRLLYGEGFKWYAMLSAKIGGKWGIHIKCDYAPKIKIGLKMRFF